MSLLYMEWAKKFMCELMQEIVWTQFVEHDKAVWSGAGSVLITKHAGSKVEIEMGFNYL